MIHPILGYRKSAPAPPMRGHVNKNHWPGVSNIKAFLRYAIIFIFKMLNDSLKERTYL